MRLFVAIPLPEDIKLLLSDLQHKDDRVRWVSQEQMHLTLKFLGQMNGFQRKQISGLLDQIKFKQFKISIDGLGFFPERGLPRVFWAGIQSDTDALFRLQADVEAAAMKAGADKDKNRFKPHVTLARLNDRSIKKSELINSDLKLSSRKFKVDHFNLYQSILQPEGAIHTVIKSFQSRTGL
jgi:RNA 2',3'-cyclic 3'-phosphodiesterase